MEKINFTITKQDKADIFSNPVMIFSHMGLAVLCVLVSFWAASSTIREISDEGRDQAMERAGRLYSMVISEQWENTAAIEDTLTFLQETEKGVVEVWLVNELAGVISPLAKAYEILQDPDLESLIGKKEAFVDISVVADRVYIPLFSSDKTLQGVLILKFSDFSTTREGIGLTSLMPVMLFALLLACVLGAITVIVASHPWRRLVNQTEAQLEDSSAALIKPQSSEAISTYDKHDFLHYRMLSRARRARSLSESNND